MFHIWEAIDALGGDERFRGRNVSVGVHWKISDRFQFYYILHDKWNNLVGILLKTASVLSSVKLFTRSVNSCKVCLISIKSSPWRKGFVIVSWKLRLLFPETKHPLRIHSYYPQYPSDKNYGRLTQRFVHLLLDGLIS